jgi:hypothetical protein
MPFMAYDVFNGDPISFAQHLVKLRAWAKEQPREPLNIHTGWHVLQGETVEKMLIRNTRNRDVKFNTVLMYATSLVNDRWKKTGEPIIITNQDDVEDGQHRLLAAYFTGKALPTFVVTEVPHDKDLFAYIDGGLSRTGEDALKIAGVNGLSKHIAAVIKDIAIRYDDGLLAYTGRLPVNPITNVDILDYARAHPGLAGAAHTVKDLYGAAAARLSDNKVATFVAWRILEDHGTAVLDDFMTALTKDDLLPTNAIAVLKKRLEEHEQASLAPKRSPKRKLRLGMVQILALTIKAFNLNQANQSVRRLDPRADDPYPRFDEPVVVPVETPVETPEAAE